MKPDSITFDTVIGSLMTALGLCAIVFVAGCNWFGDGQEGADQAKVQQQQEQYAIAQPLPHFDWSLERDLVIQLYEARNTEVATHTVWRSDYGMLEGDCESIGFGIPYDTSITNPLQSHYFNQGSVAVVEQAEPNGLFASKNSSATWVMCVVTQNGVASTVPVYVESKVTVYPFPVVVNYGSNRVTPGDGTPSVVISGRRDGAGSVPVPPVD